jgi:hypothetical protein
MTSWSAAPIVSVVPALTVLGTLLNGIGAQFVPFHCSMHADVDDQMIWPATSPAGVVAQAAIARLGMSTG